jgi:two-component system chemotaxis sensor kinase CheA
MSSKKEEFLKHLLATFKVEADDHLKIMAEGLRELEIPGAAQHSIIIERIFREVHSLKGAARSVNLPVIESICQALESIFALLKAGQLAVDPELLGLMRDSFDELGVRLGVDEAAAMANKPSVALLGRLNNALGSATTKRDTTYKAPVDQARDTTTGERDTPGSGRANTAADTRLLSGGGLSGTVRVSTAKLGVVMRQAEELLAAKQAAHQHGSDLREVEAILTEGIRQRNAAQPGLRELQRLLGQGPDDSSKARGIAKLFEYFEAQNQFVQSLEKSIGAITKSTERDYRALTRMIDGQLHEVRNLLMLPFAPLLEIFPRFVREMARDQGKKIELVIHGGEIEVDRRILEEIKDPLLHLLRNCIDHGIEPPTQRLEKQKAASGTISVTVGQKDGRVGIDIADDGRGIDAERVRAAARTLGVYTGEGRDGFDERETLALVFQSGVSTSSVISDISGRGLGMAIVREKIERLGGTVALETKPGAGTLIRMIVPSTLATIRGVLVRAGGRIFVLPLHNVECVLCLAATEIRSVENRENIFYNSKAVALARLSDVLELPVKTAQDDPAGNIRIAILNIEAIRIAFQVDEILGEQEVLVKMLGWQLARVRNVAGACVLGTGQLVPVLNPADLIKSAVLHAASGRSAVAEKPIKVQRSILVVEDSITSRALLKFILEAAGYRVTAAVDGVDAWAALEAGTFDLVVSDVEMPRMNGFELTEKIRSDPARAKLPVVLVTALDSRESREHGIDVGANAYFVKGSFEQSNLLELVGQLI